MQSVLQKRIKNYLDITGLSVSALERKAGLKINVARNILRGQSKKPTAETLQAIAKVMECSISDLLGAKRESFQSDIRPSSEGTPFLEDPQLLSESLHAILKMTKDNNYKLTLRQILFILEEVYAYTIKKKPPKIDLDFITWFIEKTLY